MPREPPINTAVSGLTERLAGLSTILHDTQQDGFRDLAADELQIRLEELDDTWTTSEKIYFDICAKFSADQRNKLQFFSEKRFDAYKKMYRDAKLTFRRCMQPQQLVVRDTMSSGLSSHVTSVTSDSNSNFSVGMLRRIDPPEFDGNRAHWLSFRESFTSMVINTSLSNIDKFNYLKRSLKGFAQDIVKGLPATSESFDVAWSELKDRYDNNRILKQCHVDSLLTVAPVARAHDYTEYERVLNEVHGNLLSLKGLGVEYESWSELLLGVIKSKFDTSLLDDWERTVSAKTFLPTYTDFKKFILSRIESKVARRSNTNVERPKRVIKVHTVNVKGCPECNHDHQLFRCPKIIHLPEKDRIEAIRKHRVCYNCLYPGHLIARCPSKRTCSICSRKHHSLLHISQGESRKRQHNDDLHSESSVKIPRTAEKGVQ